MAAIDGDASARVSDAVRVWDGNRERECELGAREGERRGRRGRARGGTSYGARRTLGRRGPRAATHKARPEIVPATVGDGQLAKNPSVYFSSSAFCLFPLVFTHFFPT